MMFHDTDISCTVNPFTCWWAVRSFPPLAAVSNAAVSLGAFSNFGYEIRSGVAGSCADCVFRSPRGRIPGGCMVDQAHGLTI